MLFAYSYVPHQMEKMQTFIDFIFDEVWCKAAASGPFSLHLFDANAELREVMELLYYSDTKSADFFYGHVERIYDMFSVLSAAQIIQFQQWYKSNNDLEKVCANDPAINIVRYKDLIVAHPILGKQLASFFRGLYDESLLKLALLKAKIGDIKDHSSQFFLKNNVGKCPFCGISDLKGLNHTRREAYDHYLPKFKYPFNSINFRNLAPACHECNSTYKLSKDPAYNLAGRRKAFNPYATTSHAIQMHVTLQHSNIEKLTCADIQLHFGPPAINDEIETWKDIYGIEERYKAKFCGPDAVDWIEQFRIMNRRQKTTADEFLQDIEDSNQFANFNFLKKAFIEACKHTGLLTTLEKYS